MATRRRASSWTGAPPDRTAGLDIDLGPLPPVPPLPQRVPAPSTTADDAAESPDAAVQPEPTPAPAGSSTRRGARGRRTGKAGVRIVSARIPASLFSQVNSARQETGDTHEMWFLRGLDAVYDELGEHYRRPEQPSRVPIPQRRARRPGEEPLAQYPLRLTVEAAKILEDLVVELQPVSMSEFVSTIVRLRLEQLARQRRAPDPAAPVRRPPSTRQK